MVYFGSQFKQEPEMDGHAAPSVRKQRVMNTDTQLIFPFYLIRDPSSWNGVTQIQGVFSSLS